ncbi:MAG: flagellar protein FlaG, partial [Bryobacteraceae bacterium]
CAMRIDSSLPVLDFAVQAVQKVQEQQAQHRELIQAVRALNASGKLGQDSELTFSLDRQTQRPVMKRVNRETNEVIEQIPTERVLRLAQELKLLHG